MTVHDPTIHQPTAAFPQLETARLLFRQITPADMDTLFQTFSDDEVIRTKHGTRRRQSQRPKKKRAMRRQQKTAVLLVSVLITLLPACSAVSTPAPTSTPTSTPAPTLTPSPTFTATPTASSTHTATPSRTATPAATATPTSSPTATQAPTSTPAPTALPTTDPLPDRQTFVSNLGFSIAYPGAWQPQDKAGSATIGSQGFAESNRTNGGELIVVAGPLLDPNASLQTEWGSVPAAFPEVSFGEPAAITLAGEAALRAVFSDPRDNSHGWFILTLHNAGRYVIVAQAIPGETWPNHESTFRAMLGTFRFTN